MPIGKLVFAQLMEFLPLHTFRRCVARYPSSYPTKTFSHLDQYLCMAFAQLTFRESLRDIEVCLQMPLASRAVLQMDQAASAHQSVFRRQRERRPNANLDRHQRLPARRQHQKAARRRGIALHNFTDFEPDAIRENARGSATQ